MGYYDYTPPDAPYPMTWPAKECDWCGDEAIVWAYPMAEVTFPRRVTPDGPAEDIVHVAQPWFACAGCKSAVDRDRWDELAASLGRPRGYYDRLRAARMDTPGYKWVPARGR